MNEIGRKPSVRAGKSMSPSTENRDHVRMTIELRGADAAMFDQFKRGEYISADAEAGRKLILERLHGRRVKRKRANAG